jgi:hypothetical protein
MDEVRYTCKEFIDAYMSTEQGGQGKIIPFPERQQPEDPHTEQAPIGPELLRQDAIRLGVDIRTTQDITPETLAQLVKKHFLGQEAEALLSYLNTAYQENQTPNPKQLIDLIDTFFHSQT